MVGGLIQFENYATQVGQYVTMGRSAWGDVSETSVTTINLLLYQEEDSQDQTNPNVTGGVRHFAIVSKDLTVQTGDHIRQVVNHLGVTVLVEARVLLVNDYHMWRHGNKFRRVQLDLDLSG